MTTPSGPCAPSRRGVLGGLAALAGAVAVGGPAAGATAGPGRAPGRERAYARTTIRRMTLEQKIGQLMTGYAYGATPDTADARNVALYGVATPAEVVREFHLGGVIYFAWTDSVRDPRQIATLSNGLQQAARGSGAGVPLLISTDQEQGVVTRVGPPATPFPGSMALGAGRSPDDARTAAAITGQELAAIGINQDFAPVADVNVNPLNPVIGVRSFSSDPDLVAEMVAAQVLGYQRDGGISACAKHFPGHGDTATDSHTALPTIDHTRAEWEEVDAPPFRAAIEAQVDSVMTAHILVPSLDASGDPATLSAPIMSGVLRGELGYRGVIITDSLEMAGVRQQYGDAEVAVRALEAGADVLLMPAAPMAARQALLDAVASGRLTEDRLDESLERVLALKYRRGLVAGSEVDLAGIAGVVGTAEHLATAQRVSDRTVTLLRNADDVLPLTAGARSVLVTGWGVATTAAVGQALGRRGHTPVVLETGARPTAARIAAAAADAATRDLVVVLTQKAWDAGVTDPGRQQQRLVAELVATGTPVVHVAVRDPYDIAYLPDVTTSLATYSYTAVSMESAVRVLHGETPPEGLLPVDVPVAGEPDEVLFPFGFGGTW
ncbi:glycoside hydrolase family 3 protein [Aquipuribacter sp. MA13-6]|uniref:glycoside hydrolase family 3 protein n=1 Tax=unclassified Aquipuribacter TaxID=2635084 RepID=UPI003EEE691C